MNKLSKFFLSIISLIGIILMGGLGLSLAKIYNFLPFAFPEIITSTYLQHNIYVGYTLLGVVAFLLVAFILLLIMTIFTPTAVKQLKIKQENGELVITKEAIENGIRYAVSGFPECRSAKVMLRLFKHKADVVVNFENELTDLSLAQELQTAINEKVNTVVYEMTGKDAKKINIKFVESKQQKKALKNNRVI